jgi:hypothetical protein
MLRNDFRKMAGPQIEAHKQEKEGYGKEFKRLTKVYPEISHQKSPVDLLVFPIFICFPFWIK